MCSLSIVTKLFPKFTSITIIKYLNTNKKTKGECTYNMQFKSAVKRESKQLHIFPSKIVQLHRYYLKLQ